MAVHTFSKFFYNFVVDASNYYLPFNEGIGEIVGDVRAGSYAPSVGLSRVATAMNNAGTQTYTVTLDRLTRKVTISSVAVFTLPVLTTTVLNNAFALLGFTGANRTGSNIYTGNLPIASEYVPQFKLQDYMPTATNQKSIDPTVRKTADGQIEVVRFGTERMLELSIKYATNKPMDGVVIRNNPTGVEDLVAFMEHVITKAAVEFMPDMLSPNDFQILIIEKTADSKDGMAYSLDEQYKKNLPDIYESGKLTFRLVET